MHEWIEQLFAWLDDWCTAGTPHMLSNSHHSRWEVSKWPFSSYAAKMPKAIKSSHHLIQGGNRLKNSHYGIDKSDH